MTATNAVSPVEPPSPDGAVASSYANRWNTRASDLAALASGPVLAGLTDLAVLEFDGADVVEFLQGQTTIDMAALSPTGWQLGGYCTPKGRLLAIFSAWRQRTGIRILLPAGIAPSVQQRLAKFVLRAKVQIRDVTPGWSAMGMCGAGAAAALAAAGIDAPAEPADSLVLDGDERIVRLPSGSGCPERLLLLIRAERQAHWRSILSNLPAVGQELWWWSQIDAGVPAITADTQELFVPQTLNLEVLGGVNFRKGCYPGQEIVARSQYLGKLRRRMFLAHTAHMGPTGDVFQDGSGEPIGRVVLAAGAPGGGWDLLFECPIDRVGNGGLRAGATDAPMLELRELPYTLFDPTA